MRNLPRWSSKFNSRNNKNSKTDPITARVVWSPEKCTSDLINIINNSSFNVEWQAWILYFRFFKFISVIHRTFLLNKINLKYRNRTISYCILPCIRLNFCGCRYILFFMYIEFKYLWIIGSQKMEEVQKYLVVASFVLIDSSTLINTFDLRVFLIFALFPFKFLFSCNLILLNIISVVENCGVYCGR